MSISTLLVTDEARSGVSIQFLFPDFRSASTGKTVSYLDAAVSQGDTVVHPFEWDANSYPCPDCLRDDPRVDKAVELAKRSALALLQPNADWENVRYTHWQLYTTARELWSVVEEKATIYDRKETLLSTIGKRAAEAYFNVCVVWLLRAARQHRISTASVVCRWQQAAGLLDGLLQEPLGKNTQTLELSADYLRMLSSVALACAHERSLSYYLVDTQHQHADNVQLAHRAHFYYALAQTISLQSLTIPQRDAWQNFLTIKSEFYDGMTFYLASVEPGTRNGNSRRRKAVDCFVRAQEAAQSQHTSKRGAVAQEISHFYTKCVKFRSWLAKGRIPEATATTKQEEPRRHSLEMDNNDEEEEGADHHANNNNINDKTIGATAGVVRFRSDDVMRSHLPNSSSQGSNNEDVVGGDLLLPSVSPVALMPPIEQLMSTHRCVHTAEEDVVQAVVSGVYSSSRSSNKKNQQNVEVEEEDLLSVDVTMVQQDIRGLPTVSASVGHLGAAQDGTAAASSETTISCYTVQAAITVRSPHTNVLQLQRGLKRADVESLCAVVFVVDLNHNDKAIAEKLRNAVVSAIQSGRLTPSDRVGLVQYDTVDAEASVTLVAASEPNLKALYLRLLKDKGRGRFPDSHGTPLVAGVKAACDALVEIPADFTGNKHIVVISNGEDRTWLSDELDWSMWSDRRFRDEVLGHEGGIELHTLAVSLAADDVLLSSLAESSNGLSHRVLTPNVQDMPQELLEIQEFVATVLATSVARVAREVQLRITPHGSNDVGGARIMIGAVEMSGSDPIARVKPSPTMSSKERKAFPKLLDLTSVATTTATTTSLPSKHDDSPSTDAINNNHSTAPSSSVGTDIALLPFALGDTTTILLTLIVPQSLAQQSMVALGTVSVSYTPSHDHQHRKIVTTPLTHVNCTTVEESVVYGWLTQAWVHEISTTAVGSAKLRPSADEVFVLRGREAVIAGDTIQTTGPNSFVSVITATGIRIDIAPDSEVRVDDIRRTCLTLHVQRGSVSVTTPSSSEATAFVTISGGYRCTLEEGGTRCQISNDGKTFTARCICGKVTVLKEITASANHTDSGNNNSNSKVNSSHCHEPVVLWMSRQTSDAIGSDSPLSNPWLLSLTDAEKAVLTGTDSAARRNSFSEESAQLADEVPPASTLSEATSNAGKPPALTIVANESNMMLRAMMLMDTFRSRLAIHQVVKTVATKLEGKLRKYTNDQRASANRARNFLINYSLSDMRSTLANSIAYICENRNLDIWRAAMEFVGRIVLENDESLTWQHVYMARTIARSLAYQRSFSIFFDLVFETPDVKEQRSRVREDTLHGDHLEASTALRAEEQLMSRQSEEHRREMALLRLFQQFQWEGFATVWVKDVLSVLSNVPNAPAFRSVASRASEILRAIGGKKSLTDAQFATALEVAFKHLSPVEFTVVTELLGRRAAHTQELIEESPQSRALFVILRALDSEQGTGVVTVTQVEDLVERALLGRSWTRSTCVATTTPSALGTRMSWFAATAERKYLQLVAEAIQPPMMRRKSSARFTSSSKLTAATASAATAATTTNTSTTSSNDLMSLTSIVPEPVSLDSGIRCIPLSIEVTLPAMKEFFISVIDEEDAFEQIRVMHDIADGLANKARTFDQMMAHEAKLREMRQLETWERKHVFDGISDRDIAKVVSSHFTLPSHIKTTLDVLVAPVCILLGLVPSPPVKLINLFEGFTSGAGGAAAAAAAPDGSRVSHWATATRPASASSNEGGDEVERQSSSKPYWSFVQQQIQYDFRSFVNRLQHFSPLAVTYRLLLLVLPHINHKDLDPLMLAPISPVLASLAKWTLLNLRLIFLVHDELDIVEGTVPSQLVNYVNSKKFDVPQMPSATLAIVASTLRPTSPTQPLSSSASTATAVARVSPPRRPTSASVSLSRPSSAKSSNRVWGEVCATSPHAERPPSNTGGLTTRFSTEGPRPPTFSQKLKVRPSTAGTLRSGFTEPGPLPSVVGAQVTKNGGWTATVPTSPTKEHAALYLPSDISKAANDAVFQRAAKSNTVTRPQSAYVRSAARSYQIGSSTRVGTEVSSHQFFGDTNVPLLAGTPSFRAMNMRPSSAALAGGGGLTSPRSLQYDGIREERLD